MAKEIQFETWAESKPLSAGSSSALTSASLLARIRHDAQDESAWREFVERYGNRVYSWCRQRKLQPHDAEDVTQEVLVKLAQRLGTFEYDPQLTFRGWLRRVTENAIADFYREMKAGREPEVLDLRALQTPEAKRDLQQRLHEAFDLELFDLAKSKVRAQVEPTRWLAWELTAVQNLSGEETAKRLDMKLPTVYSAKSKIQKMIRDEVQQLTDASATDVLS